MTLVIPKPKVTKEQLDKFLKNPEILTLEIFFVILTLANVFVLYRILLNICPFPVLVTWSQLLTGFLFAYVLGEASKEFPRCAFFPPFSINWKLYESLGLPTLIYLGMITFANIILHATPSVATFPVIVSLAVAFHHASRFLGCGQIYVPIRWVAIGIMVMGFFFGIFDKYTMGLKVFPIALMYATFSAIFRAWCLEKAMHVVEGRGNTLHNHQVAMGLLVLPIFVLLFGEWRVFTWMPLNFSRLFTWQAWGCLITAGTIPFVKNIVANRMIRRTGQAPWRVLEIISMFLVFVIGWIVFDSVSFIGTIASILVISGRVLGMMDALSQEPEARRRALRQEGVHTAAPNEDEGRYDVTGVSEGFDRTDAYQTGKSKSRPSEMSLSTSRNEIELEEQNDMVNENAQNAVKPLLSPTA